MADSITNINHPRFKYVFIPQAVEDPVQVREYEGNEGSFQDLMKAHFTSLNLTQQEQQQLNEGLKEEVQKQMAKQENKNATPQANDKIYDSLADVSANRYQIVPLTLPTKATNFEAVNAYIDNVGRVKGLQTNARASRITSNDIRGDCFLSKTFDDDETFKRIDFDLNQYEAFLQNPPSSEGRWSPEQLTQLTAPPPSNESSKHCQNCFKENVKLMKCGKCKKVAYCSVECQKADWMYHKRLCVGGV
eukprot:Protomagalhaensia_wolfi_Nauph_80__2467@NODE_2638_length_1032_cov_17_098691_g2066_i0_p1_GENE_NODE_2638_length_1032_cov_17_098691_g2066_i0NODE_2638_length_1032_cov_17_098691_g2066_i0_p1_ORF_typecomplete_len247_score53_48zfMYND/PF01753_18/1_2e12zfC6H2/PF15801_5/0_21Pesticin/PF16754_5/0_11Meleagrin/PF08189_11/1_1e04Meleagrin/PF08189_11/0_055zfHIT/PF04438_16/4zfMss51/PF13824_6/10_NODE_2638_length_1032_cov_17_098691_g2066_i0236976